MTRKNYSYIFFVTYVSLAKDKDKMTHLKSYLKKKHIIILLCCFVYCVFSFLIYGISRFFPSVVYKVYTLNIYRVLTLPLKAFASVLPFSVAEILLLILITAIILGLFISLYLKKIRQYVALLFCIIFFIGGNFVWLGGMNYNALTFKDLAGYNVTKPEASDLERLCFLLAEKASESRKALKENSSGIITDSRNVKNILTESEKGFKELSASYNFFNMYTTTPKAALSSSLMCYEQISGIFPIVYTESLINSKAPVYSIPHTACHELSHQFGFMQEDEANFIGFLACINNSDPLYVYSGYYSALISAMNKLHTYNYDAWLRIRSTADQGVFRDISFESEFWSSYEKKAPGISQLSQNVNDKYLQANNVTDGAESYGRMVDLLIAHYRTQI